MTCSRIALDTKQSSYFGFNPNRFNEHPAIKPGDGFAVAGDESFAQRGPFPLFDPGCFVSGRLSLSELRGRRQFAEVQITNAKFTQPLLQSTAVGKRVFAATHTAPPANVAECGYTSLLELLEKALFGKAINPNRDDLHKP